MVAGGQKRTETKLKNETAERAENIVAGPIREQNPHPVNFHL